MHTLEYGGWRLIHHGDHMGSCRLVAPNKDMAEGIPTELLRLFVAEQIRASRIDRLEQASTAEILRPDLLHDSPGYNEPNR